MAFGHGGARPGAGGPRGGISELRRTLNHAIVDGLAMAGERAGIEGDRATQAREAAARIVSDMILAGRGEEVLKLAAVIAPKVGEDKAPGDDSPVLAALKRMPGMVPGHNQATYSSEPDESAAPSMACGTRTTDCQSDGAGEAPKPGHQVQSAVPYFAPQLPLLPAELEAPAARLDGGAGGRGRAPTPPAAGTRPPLYPETAPLENFQNGAAA